MGELERGRWERKVGKETGEKGKGLNIGEMERGNEKDVNRGRNKSGKVKLGGPNLLLTVRTAQQKPS